MKPSRILVVGGALLACMASSVGVRAETISTLNPPAEHYRLGSFSYKAPVMDGWRQLGAGQGALELVYVEQIDTERINTRAQITARAFDIPEGANIGDAGAMAEISQKQQISSRGEALVSSQPVAPVHGKSRMRQYSLTSSGGPGGKNIHEAFFVSLAPDRKQYLMLHLMSLDPDYAEQLYYAQFFGSLTSVIYAPDADADSPAVPSAGGPVKSNPADEPTAGSGAADPKPSVTAPAEKDSPASGVRAQD